MTLGHLARIAAAVLLVAASALAAGRLPIPEDRPYDVPFIPRPSTARLLFPSHPTLAANLYWLRTVQYIGDPRANERGWERLLPLAELLTDLDPKHGYAYQVVGTILSSVNRIEESNRILEKGMRNVPDRYILPYHRAFNAFYYDGDFETAGRFVEIAAHTPGAPAAIRQNVLTYYVKANRADLALQFLGHALGEARDDETRKALAGQIEQARFEQVATVLDEAAERFRERHGRAPARPDELVTGGVLPRLPDDPFGGAWRFGADGRARSTLHERRIGRAPRPGELPPAPGVGLGPPKGPGP